MMTFSTFAPESRQRILRIAIRFGTITSVAVAAAALFVFGSWYGPRLAGAPVTAATFDADLRTTSTDMYAIGTTAAEWLSVNDTLFFTSSSRLGISSSSFTPVSRAEVRGGDVYLDTYGCGVLLTDSNGVCWRAFAVSSTGALFTATTSCTAGCSY
jgi:hypothetical protein